MAITSVANYKAYLGVAGSANDTALTLILAAVEEMVADYTGRTFEDTEYTDEVYSGDGSQILHLKNWPVTTLTSVEVLDDSGTATTLSTDTYRADLTLGTIYRHPLSKAGRVAYDEWGGVTPTAFRPYPVWPEGWRNILVTYQAGYEAGSFPDRLLLAIYRMVDHVFAQRGIDPSLLSERLGDYQYQRADVSAAFESIKHREFGQFRRSLL